jgi:hypothetical protein
MLTFPENAELPDPKTLHTLQRMHHGSSIKIAKLCDTNFQRALFQ